MNGQTFTEYEAQHLSVLHRIAVALETLAMANAPAPNFAKPIEAYAPFDPSTIGAIGKERDEHGWTALEWGGYIWTRRSPQNKFGEAIWFSRPVGKNADDGSVKYIRLITFRKFTEAEPLPRKVEALVDAAKKPEATHPEPTLDEVFGPNPRLTKEEDAPDWCKTHQIKMTETSPKSGIPFHRIVLEDGKVAFCDGATVKTAGNGHAGK